MGSAGVKVQPLHQMIARAERIIEEIDQLFIDVDYWNNYVRKPPEPPIDPDPDGELKRIRHKVQSDLNRLVTWK